MHKQKINKIFIILTRSGVNYEQLIILKKNMSLDKILTENFENASIEEKNGAIKMYELLIQILNESIDNDNKNKRKLKRCSICFEKILHPYSKEHINSKRHIDFLMNKKI